MSATKHIVVVQAEASAALFLVSLLIDPNAEWDTESLPETTQDFIEEVASELISAGPGKPTSEDVARTICGCWPVLLDPYNTVTKPD